jgi:hypothetical protein
MSVQAHPLHLKQVSCGPCGKPARLTNIEVRQTDLRITISLVLGSVRPALSGSHSQCFGGTRLRFALASTGQQGHLHTLTRPKKNKKNRVKKGLEFGYLKGRYIMFLTNCVILIGREASYI